MSDPKPATDPKKVDPLEKLKAKKAQIDAKIQRLEARKNEQKRNAETRAATLIGLSFIRNPERLSSVLPSVLEWLNPKDHEFLAQFVKTELNLG